MGVLNYKLLVEYDGSAFSGWQSQRRGRTVQAELEAALAQVMPKAGRLKVTGAGRTDAGVHARGQVANVLLETGITPERLCRALNSHLGEDVRVQDIAMVPHEFHARNSATGRYYSYTMTVTKPVLGRQYVWVLKYHVDRDLLMECARTIVGCHDFVGFVKSKSGVNSTTCEVAVSEWDFAQQKLIYHIHADRFLHHMVRYLVGTMVEVARGRYTLEQFHAQVAGVAGTIMVYRAPAQGLVLEEVFY
jgi:tRNA pseudouridine38-40 synthase